MDSYPDTVFIEKGVFSQSLNFEFRCHNTSKQGALLESISATGFDKQGNLLFKRGVDSSAMAPSVEVVPERSLDPGKTLEIFNPIAELPLEYTVERMDFTLRFITKDPDNVQSQISIKPATYKQKTLLDLPFKGTCLITDGHDLPAHHRRIPLLNPNVSKIGLTANSGRFAYDFTLADLNGKIFKQGGSKVEDYYGWGKPVLCPGDGKVVSTACDKPDTSTIRQDFPPLTPEEYQQLRTQAFENLEKLGMQEILGNHVIIDHGNGEFSSIDHMQQNSVTVNIGDQVARGTPIGKIGNSGDSWFPHIHYAFQNGKDIFTSEGLPSRFREFELLLGTDVKRIENLCPNTGMIIKS
ncbi:MAG: M23 family metallopeptidase [Candidatus Bathyarchaeia archaeon]